jgi:hypothetical protein
VTYYSPNKELAESYVDMHDGGRLTKHDITISNPALWEVIRSEAIKLRFDEEEVDDYTPASVFDTNLFGEVPVRKLVDTLKQLGYDGAILTDIAYGKNITDQAYVVFNSPAQIKSGMMMLAAASEARIHALVKKYNTNLEFVQECAEEDPTPNGIYTEWIVKNYKDIIIPPGRLNARLKTFTKLKNSPQFRAKFKTDINAYDPDSFRKLIDWEVSPSMLSKKERRRDLTEQQESYLEAGAQLIGQVGDTYLYRCTTPEAAALMARNSHWCTKSLDQAKGYLHNAPLYIVMKEGHGEQPILPYVQFYLPPRMVGAYAADINDQAVGEHPYGDNETLLFGPPWDSYVEMISKHDSYVKEAIENKSIVFNIKDVHFVGQCYNCELMIKDAHKLIEDEGNTYCCKACWWADIWQHIQTDIKHILDNYDKEDRLVNPEDVDIDLTMEVISYLTPGSEEDTWEVVVRALKDLDVIRPDAQQKVAAVSDARKNLLHNKYKVKDEIIKQLGDEVDPSVDGKYTDWLTRCYRRKQIRLPEDTEKIKTGLEQFERLKRSPNFTSNKDIGTYQTVGNFLDMVDQSTRTDLSKHDQRKEIEQNTKQYMAGAKLIDERWGNQYYEVTTAETASAMAQGTQWCTRTESTAQYYLDQAPLFIIRRENESVAQFHGYGIDTFQFMDRSDKPIGDPIEEGEYSTETLAYRISPAEMASLEIIGQHYEPLNKLIKLGLVFTEAGLFDNPTAPLWSEKGGALVTLEAVADKRIDPQQVFVLCPDILHLLLDYAEYSKNVSNLLTACGVAHSQKGSGLIELHRHSELKELQNLLRPGRSNEVVKMGYIYLTLMDVNVTALELSSYPFDPIEFINDINEECMWKREFGEIVPQMNPYITLDFIDHNGGLVCSHCSAVIAKKTETYGDEWDSGEIYCSSRCAEEAAWEQDKQRIEDEVASEMGTVDPQELKDAIAYVMEHWDPPMKEDVHDLLVDGEFLPEEQTETKIK